MSYIPGFGGSGNTSNTVCSSGASVSPFPGVQITCTDKDPSMVYPLTAGARLDGCHHVRLALALSTTNRQMMASRTRMPHMLATTTTAQMATKTQQRATTTLALEVRTASSPVCCHRLQGCTWMLHLSTASLSEKGIQVVWLKSLSGQSLRIHAECSCWRHGRYARGEPRQLLQRLWL